MIIYNVTINIDDDMQSEWLNWMKNIHIPDVLSTGCFIGNKICKILGESEGGSSYSIQYTCKDMEVFNYYQKKYAKVLQQKHKNRFNGKFAAFRTLLKVVSENNLNES